MAGERLGRRRRSGWVHSARCVKARCLSSPRAVVGQLWTGLAMTSVPRRLGKPQRRTTRRTHSRGRGRSSPSAPLADCGFSHPALHRPRGRRPPPDGGRVVEIGPSALRVALACLVVAVLLASVVLGATGETRRGFRAVPWRPSRESRIIDDLGRTDSPRDHRAVGRSTPGTVSARRWLVRLFRPPASESLGGLRRADLALVEADFHQKVEGASDHRTGRQVE